MLQNLFYHVKTLYKIVNGISFSLYFRADKTTLREYFGKYSGCVKALKADGVWLTKG